MTSYWSDKFLDVYNKAKEKSREIRMASYPVDSSRFNINNIPTDSKNVVISKTADIPGCLNVSQPSQACFIETAPISADNNLSSISKLENNNIKYSEPFTLDSAASVTAVSHSTFIDYNISKSNCLPLSIDSVTFSNPSALNSVKNSVNLNCTSDSSLDSLKSLI